MKQLDKKEISNVAKSLREIAKSCIPTFQNTTIIFGSAANVAHEIENLANILEKIVKSKSKSKSEKWWRKWVWEDDHWVPDDEAFCGSRPISAAKWIQYRPFDIDDTGPKHPPRSK